MDDRRALAKLRKAKTRFYGGLFIVLFTSIFIFAGLSSQQSFPVIFGVICVCYGILYSISGIVTWYKVYLQVIKERPKYHVPSANWQARSQDNPDSWYFLAEESVNQEQVKKAIEAFNRALKIEPNFPAAWFGLARAWRLLQNYEQVLEAARKGLTINPLDAGGLLLFGEACIHLKEYIKARQALEACLKIERNNMVARELLHNLEERFNQYLN